MTIEPHRISFGSETIEFTIARRDRKTLEIAVEPDTSVVVAAPNDASLEAIEAKLQKRGAWILRQRRYFAQFLPRRPARKYVPGETHLYLGRQYRLKVVPHIQQEVKLLRGFIVVQSHRPKQTDLTRDLLDAWYRQRAQFKFMQRIEFNLNRFPDPEAYRPQGLIVRQLSQRWGSISSASRLLLNRRLIEAPVDAIDYVITHELCHISEPHHGTTFYSLLAQVLPDWEKRKSRLERFMA